MTQIPGKELQLQENKKTTKSAGMKRTIKTAGVVAISMGLVTAAGLPAYAVTPEVTANVKLDDFGAPVQSAEAAAQALRTAQGGAESVVNTDVQGAVSAAAIAEEAAKAAAEKAEAEKKALEEQVAKYAKDVPAGVGASGIVAAALSQLGDFQDCTALVERSLRAVGIPAGDLGTQVYEYTNLGGHIVTSGDYAPGDVLVWAGRHVAVYIGNGQAVHGGYGGNRTVIASAFLDGTPTAVVRF